MGKKRKKLDFEPDTKPPSAFSEFLSKLREYIKKPIQRAPMTFNLGVAVILFFCYISIIIVRPQLEILLIFIPTLYIIICYMRLEREKYNEKHK